jgi:hypothetical protein
MVKFSRNTVRAASVATARKRKARKAIGSASGAELPKARRIWTPAIIGKNIFCFENEFFNPVN